MSTNNYTQLVMTSYHALPTHTVFFTLTQTADCSCEQQALFTNISSFQMDSFLMIAKYMFIDVSKMVVEFLNTANRQIYKYATCAIFKVNTIYYVKLEFC